MFAELQPTRAACVAQIGRGLEARGQHEVLEHSDLISCASSSGDSSHLYTIVCIDMPSWLSVTR